MADSPLLSNAEKDQLYMDEMICGIAICGEKDGQTLRVDPMKVICAITPDGGEIFKYEA